MPNRLYVFAHNNKVTGRRVLPSDGGGPEVEISLAESGKRLELDINAFDTYWSVLRPDGTLYGEGRAVIMAANGEGASLVGQGVGRFTEMGGASFRGAVYIYSSGATLSRLKGVAVAFEHEADANDNTKTTL